MGCASDAMGAESGRDFSYFGVNSAVENEQDGVMGEVGSAHGMGLEGGAHGEGPAGSAYGASPAGGAHGVGHVSGSQSLGYVSQATVATLRSM